jgi:alkylresorcinol/alkylpyrone synthase
MGEVFQVDASRLNAMMAVVDNCGVLKRHIVNPAEWYSHSRTLSETTLEYRNHSIALGSKAAEDCLQRANLRAAEIDLLITVSCTGVMIPSLDAHLINGLGFRSDVKRVPITELGCAAGAAALARAADYVRAYPNASVLVVAVELPTLTFQRSDLSLANLISTVLFGDGAAAAIVTGRPIRGPKVIDGGSHLFPNTTSAMGFDLKEDGFHIILSKDVPILIHDNINPVLDNFFAANNLIRSQIAAWILHPGGRKLLSNLELALGLRPADTKPSWDVMRDYGNLSSASVLFVLKEWMETRETRTGEYGLLAAFGPGFSVEMLLLQWD